MPLSKVWMLNGMPSGKYIRSIKVSVIILYPVTHSGIPGSENTRAPFRLPTGHAYLIGWLIYHESVVMATVINFSRT